MSDNWIQMEYDIQRCCKQLGYTHIADRAASPCRGDWFIRVVLACKADLYATWLYNANDDMLYNGHYNLTADQAHNDYLDRGCENIEEEGG